MPQDDLQSYLKAVPTTDDVRANAWEAYNRAKDQADFQQKIGALNIPQQAKADLWESKYNGKGLKAQPMAAASTPTTQPIQAVTPPQDHQSLLSKAWGWANTPVNLGHLRDSIAQSEADSNAAPTMADANSPWHEAGTLIKHGVEGFGADAAKMLLTPLGIGMAAAGPIGSGTGKVALGAKAALTAVGLGFGAQGGADLYKHGITPMPGEKPEDYVRRVGGDAAMLTGGAAGVAEVPHLVEGLRGGVAKPETVPAAPTTTPSAPSTWTVTMWIVFAQVRTAKSTSRS